MRHPLANSYVILRLKLRTGPSSPPAASRTKCRAATWAWMVAAPEAWLPKSSPQGRGF